MGSTRDNPPTLGVVEIAINKLYRVLEHLPEDRMDVYTLDDEDWETIRQVISNTISLIRTIDRPSENEETYA